jgi:hypothetical protein
MTALSRHIAESRSALPMWHLCADKTCTRFVARAGFRCEECANRAKRLNEQLQRIADVLASRARRPWMRGTLRALYPIWARGQHLRNWWREYAGSWVGMDSK